MTARSEVQQVLDRAVARGQLSHEQADAILATERAERATPAASVARVQAPLVSPTVEALGYVGGALVLVSAATIIGQNWEDIPQAGRLALLAATAGVLFVVGLVLRDESEPVIWRLRNFVWLLSAGALAGFTAVLAVDTLEWGGEAVAISIGATLAVFGAALWRLEDRPAQQATVAVGVVVATSGAMAMLDGQAAVGASMVVVGGAWLALGVADLLPPRYAALVLGVLPMLIGPAVMTPAWDDVAPVLGLTIAVGLVVFGSQRGEFLVTGPAVVGLMIYLPFTMAQLFGDAVAPPVIMLVSGLTLLGVMFVLLRRHPGHPGHSGRSGHHAPA